MANEIMRDKKTKIFEIKRGINKLDLLNKENSDSSNGLILIDILISKKKGELIFRMNDKKNSYDFIEIDEEGVKSFSFPTGLSFWKGADLEIYSNKDCLLTITYLINAYAKDYSIWSL